MKYAFYFLLSIIFNYKSDAELMKFVSYLISHDFDIYSVEICALCQNKSIIFKL